MQLSNNPKAYEYAVKALAQEGFSIPPIDSTFRAFLSLFSNMGKMKKSGPKLQLEKAQQDPLIKAKMMRVALYWDYVQLYYFLAEKQIHYAEAVTATIVALKQNLPFAIPAYVMNTSV
jgi:hypothetical protein